MRSFTNWKRVLNRSRRSSAFSLPRSLGPVLVLRSTGAVAVFFAFVSLALKRSLLPSSKEDSSSAAKRSSEAAPFFFFFNAARRVTAPMSFEQNTSRATGKLTDWRLVDPAPCRQAESSMANGLYSWSAALLSADECEHAWL